ncbi:MAG: bifunctional ADP-dependent NAD(P)H-hydrate dehydratase/NAD(P)H-hydrate epimerase [Flavobacteriaceae bacterium]|nr:bifunctional ADP-dependent NAD(P)H-hydrate dehydratase/NAD(P)H-hydrate epimerase [Flavobacteriaceae bacterium]|tara:strand:- start:10734 stop:12275 length:1542 start_codon:yes stop_codon:yes gene_type:complete
MKLFSAAQLQEADKVTTKKHGVTLVELMERAGTQIFNWLHHRMQGAQVPIHIFCGIGNNGGDGLVVGRLLIEHGYNVHVYIANFTDKRSKCFLINYDRIKEVTKKWPKLMTSEADFPEIKPEDIIIDGLFGIGLNRPPEGWVKKLIQYVNEQKSFKLSIDIPSGMYANKALEDAEAVIKANHTLTFQAPKLSFFLPETGRFAPYFEVLEIGLDPEFLHTAEPIAQVIAKPEAQQFYKQREKYSHKGTYGHSLIVGGSYGKMGAAILSTKAAYRTGSGLVTAFVPECGYEILQSTVPEAMVLTDVEANVITKIKYGFEPSAIAVGMGIGTQPDTVAALSTLFKEARCPMVIDADAINCLANHEALLKELPELSVLTPHPGELERLVGEWKDDYEKLEKTKAFAKKYNVIVVIKGANTVVVIENRLYINTTGNPGMATGGTGDVLSGMIVGLLSQGYDPLIASVFGVYLHGSAGNLVTQDLGFEALMAHDVIENIGASFLELFAPDQTEQETKNA